MCHKFFTNGDVVLGLVESLGAAGGELDLRDLSGAAELDLGFQSRLLLYSVILSPRNNS